MDALNSKLAALLFAALAAFMLPQVVGKIANSFFPSHKIIYEQSGNLFWSPQESTRSSNALDGSVFDSQGNRTGLIKGWKGLLLGIPLDLNSATGEDLQSLPGIGPKLASAIVENRQQEGFFRSLDDLARVRGMGEKTVERLRPWLSVKSVY